MTTNQGTSLIAWVRRRRLAAQHLDAAVAWAPEQVVHHLLAVQAQEVELSWWSVAQRTPAATVTDLRHALDAGAILRTHVLRPTWHLVHRDDLRWLARLTAPRVHSRNGHRYRTLGLDPSTLERGHRLLVSILEGTDATRSELAHALAAAGIAATGQRLAHLLMHAELEQVICSGPPRDRQHTYALVDDRIPMGTPAVADDEALGRLAVRFLTGHGPATASDLRTWASLTVAQTRRAFEVAGDQLHRATIGGTEVYFLADDVPGSSPEIPPTPQAHLLQPYDEYLSGHSDTRHWIDPRHQTAEHGRRLHGDVLIDGVLIGTWRRQLGPRRITIELSLPTQLDTAMREEVSAAAHRYGAYRRLPIDVTLKDPS